MVKTNPRRRRNKERTSGGGFRNILAVLDTTSPACDNSYADGASGEPNHRGLKRKAAGAVTGSCAAADGLSLSSPSVHGAPATAVELWTVQGSKRSKRQRAAWTLLRSEEPRELRDSVTAGEQPIPRTAQVVETKRREERYMGRRQSLQENRRQRTAAWRASLLLHQGGPRASCARGRRQQNPLPYLLGQQRYAMLHNGELWHEL
uniref:Uncharacterized protein n=1 Tax=Mantoniella antarctica TaxID=81844 RepID=A0A7S0X5F8_9CHLO|mmetsp:Transcript_14956/g.36761  ORF Transcript_14956/g.36761 Transcript_14956/m.36761 type:complete len:205 (+) Transcript_14956:225-839(+)